jgi:hypothetical protein
MFLLVERGFRVPVIRTERRCKVEVHTEKLLYTDSILGG